MTDLTAITTPFGLLDDATREALRRHGGPYEWYLRGGWRTPDETAFRDDIAYRVKPSPPKPREWHINPDGRAMIEINPGTDTDDPPQGWVHVREVT